MNARSRYLALAGSYAARRPWSVWTVGSLAILAIAGVDYFAGVEVRTFPLYYAPISLVAWYRGRSGALIATAVCAACWVASNYLAGLRYSQPGIWLLNTGVQASSFAIVGLLISRLRVALMTARGLSRTDSVTSLLNTRAFYDDARRILALCRRKKRPVTIVYLDLDNFKSVNDRLGHQAGDDLLRNVANLLQSSIRPSDLSARLGGDEFVILLPDVGAAEAAATLERLRSLLADTVLSPPGIVTSSIGAVTFMTVPEDVEDMVRQADARMYAAKATGKNRVHLEIAGAEDPGRSD